MKTCFAEKSKIVKKHYKIRLIKGSGEIEDRFFAGVL